MRNVPFAIVPAVFLIAGTQLFGEADDKGGAFFAAPIIFVFALLVVARLRPKR